MTAIVFIDATWFVAMLGGVIMLLGNDVRHLRWGGALVGAWLLAVLILAIVRG